MLQYTAPSSTVLNVAGSFCVIECFYMIEEERLFLLNLEETIMSMEIVIAT